MDNGKGLEEKVAIEETEVLRIQVAELKVQNALQALQIARTEYRRLEQDLGDKYSEDGRFKVSEIDATTRQATRVPLEQGEES